MNINDTLERRVMTVPDPGQEEQYVLAETEGPETYPLVWDVDNPPDTNGRRTQYDVNTATFKKILKRKDQPGDSGSSWMFVIGHCQPGRCLSNALLGEYWLPSCSQRPNQMGLNTKRRV
jgi:hypothetical protein